MKGDAAKRVIRLKAREFAPKPGLDPRLGPYLRKLEGEKNAHVLVQFSVAPSLSERRALNRQFKISLLDPVPERAYFAAMPADLSLVRRFLSAISAARWVGVIEPKYKVAPWLVTQGLPPHARRDKDRGELIVQFFGDVPTKRQVQVLQEHHVAMLTRIEPLNGWRVIMEKVALLRLATEDSVKWIEEVPAPPEVDNDGVRSASGVNADPVFPPSVYNLTGAGVIVAQWEPNHASLTHADLAGRIVLADPPLLLFDRTVTHDESVAANGAYDNGEGIYRDIDDSGTVSPGDVRVTPVGGFAAGSIVVAGDPDVGNVLVLFNPLERFADTVAADLFYTPGEAVYLDTDGNPLLSTGTVTPGDTRLTPAGGFPAGSVVAVGDADVGQSIRSFTTNPHGHATHVAGTVIGNGAGSAAQGGAPNQWQGVAPGATLRSYAGNPTSATGAPIPSDEYTDAAANGVVISTNSWGTSHIHEVVPPNTGYNSGTQYYDAVISGRRSDGTPSGIAQRVLIFGSAGNQGRPERHTENVAANGTYDNGESIYRDNDDDGLVSSSDVLLSGPAQPLGTPLVNFNVNEMHDETISTLGTYNSGEGIYLDADGSRTVSVGDTRITAVGAFPAGSIVAAGDADVGRMLRQFKLWGNTRIPNSAKDTVEVGSITSDTAALAASSSRGPTDDGRLKPDVVGPGDQAGGDGGTTSSWPSNLYAVLTGTSMATPAVAGSAALLTEMYRSACSPGGPSPDTLRALLVHSAEDLTTIPNVGAGFVGPDFAHGYGRVRAREAIDLVPHHVVGTATVVGDTDYTVTIGAMAELKVTLVWDDPPWTANAAPSALTGLLQNDLDLVLIAPDGTQHTPWVLTPSNPFSSATRSAIAGGSPVPASARDRLNTIEQVVVDNATAGTWTIRVTASSLNLPPQTYTLVSEVLPPQLSPCAGSASDVWMRDNAADTGAAPSSGTMWLSPDIWNRNAPDGMTTHQNPEFGQENSIYANIRNAGAVTVAATSIDVWLAAAAVGLAWPDDFTFVGRISVPNLGPAEIRQVGPLPWNPPPPTPSNHYCLYVRVQSPQDPITFIETSSVGTNAANSNNIVWRNINVVDLLSSRSVTFVLRNIDQKAADVDLALEIPEEFLRRGQVEIRLSRELRERWRQKSQQVPGVVSLESRYRVVGGPELHLADRSPHVGAPGREGAEAPSIPYRLTAPKVTLQGFRMEPRHAERIVLTFRTTDKRKESYDIHVVERIRARTVGGILYVIRTGQHPRA